MSLTASAVPWAITCWHDLGYCLTGFPSAPSISVTGRELQCRPRAATVAYAPAISSGLTLGTPSVKVGTRSACGPVGLVSSTPMDWASL